MLTDLEIDDICRTVKDCFPRGGDVLPQVQMVLKNKHSDVKAIKRFIVAYSAEHLDEVAGGKPRKLWEYIDTRLRDEATNVDFGRPNEHGHTPADVNNVVSLMRVSPHQPTRQWCHRRSDQEIYSAFLECNGYFREHRRPRV